MKIAIVTQHMPFSEDENFPLAQTLAEALTQLGHTTALIRLPLADMQPLAVLQSVLANRLLRVPNTDKLLTIGFPACALRHQDKIVWLPDRLEPFGQFAPLDQAAHRITYATQGLRLLLARALIAQLQDARQVAVTSQPVQAKLAALNVASVVAPALSFTSNTEQGYRESWRHFFDRLLN